MEMGLPRNRVDIVKYIRTKYHSDKNFFDKVEGLVKAVNIPECENLIRELTLFGEAFIYKGRCLVPPEYILVRKNGNDTLYFYDYPKANIRTQIKVQAIIRKVSPFDIRGTSFFNLETLEMENREEVINFIRKGVSMLNPKPKFLMMEVDNFGEVQHLSPGQYLDLETVVE